jgi:GT2 family glycosyltransferase
MSMADTAGRLPDLHVVSVVGEAPDPHLDIAIDTLGREWSIHRTEVSLSDTAASLGGAARRTLELFADTPRPLIDAWLFARAMSRAVPDGAHVLISDRRGIGGIAALEQAQRDIEVRRTVFSIAGSSRFLSDTATFGTTDHVELPEASEIDWELVQYRHAGRVLATSRLAVAILAQIGVVAELLTEQEAPSRDPIEQPIQRVFAPGAVARRNRTGEVLRSLADLPQTSITVSDVDTIDAVWSGTTWEANRAIRRLLGERLVRSSEPPREVDLVVIGDPFTVPDESIRGLHRSGTPIAAPTGSVASAMWADLHLWDTSDDLASIVAGRRGGLEQRDGRVGHASSVQPSATRPMPNADRARRVSVGIPAFGPSNHLEECLASILDQRQPVFEILVMDDGSQSAELDRTLERWASVDDRIRIMRQPNRGVCVARNAMLDAMRGDAFVLVDQDDVLEPDFVSATANALRSDSGLAAVATWTEFFGDYSAVEAKPPFDPRIARRENPIVSTAALVDISVRDRGLRFEPDLAFLYCEDWNYWSQIVAAGGAIGLVPAPLIRHRVHRESGGFQRTDLALRMGRARALEPFLG